MSILAWLVVGLIAGLLAKYVVPGEGPGGRRLGERWWKLVFDIRLARDRG